MVHTGNSFAPEVFQGHDSRGPNEIGHEEYGNAGELNVKPDKRKSRLCRGAILDKDISVAQHLPGKSGQVIGAPTSGGVVRDRRDDGR